MTKSNNVSCWNLIIVIFIILSLNACGERVHTRFSIVSLRNETNTEGSFFLGSGSFEGREYILTFYKYGSGFKRWKIPMAKAIIYEDENQYPYVDRWLNEWDGYRRYEIHVPKGTIIREFQLK